MNRQHGFFLLNSYECHWRIKPEQGVLEIDVAGPPADYVVIYGPAWRDTRSVTTYTALTGRPPLVPRWAFGLWVTGYPQQDQAHVLALVDEHRRHALPLDAVILDYHWEEGFHNFRWRRSTQIRAGEYTLRRDTFLKTQLRERTLSIGY